MEIQEEAEYHPVFPGLAVDLSRQVSNQTIAGLESVGLQCGIQGRHGLVSKCEVS